MIGRQLQPLSEIARELIADERQRGPEEEALKQRVLERAREAMAPDRPSGVALRLAGGAAWPSARRAPPAVLLVAAAVAMAGLAAAGVGIYRLNRTPAEKPAAVVAPVAAPRAAAPQTQPATPPPTLPAEQRTEAVTPEPQRAVAPAESPPTSSVQQYAVELGLLEPARSSIGRGDYGGAMAAIARHQREYPRGQLAEEREALRVRALWGMGQKGSAENAAAAFRKRYPRSVLLSWMKEPGKLGR